MEKLFKKNYIKIILLIALIILYVALYKIYMPRVSAFGCFDDCNNFMGGYFLLHGKRLFTEIFFNHNPFMAYISWFVQILSIPENLYELILRHRQLLLVFSFLCNVLLVIRFGIPAFAFAVFYELTKFYLFGDRFLAEPFIVYLLVYMVGLAWYKLQNKPLTLFDYIASGVFAWFIIFMREPYVPATLLLFGYLLWPFVNENFFPGATRYAQTFVLKKFYSLTFLKKFIVHNKNFVWGFSVFFILTVVTLVLHDVGEFIFNAITVNVGLATGEIRDVWHWVKIFFYPVLLFFGGEWGYFRYLILSLNALFLISSVLLIVKKQWKLVLFIWIILGLLNIRWVEPGEAFYGAFHLLCWYAIFLFVSFLMLAFLHKKSMRLSLVLGSLYMCILIFHIVSPLSFLQQKPDPQYELITNYGIPMQVGSVIKDLSIPTDTLFVDGFDDIIYWQSKRFSTYQYSWYTSLMPAQKKYTDARIEMFRKSPPDFYYGSCPKEKNTNYLLPSFIKDAYIRLNSGKNPSCLWVKKTKLKNITKDQWQKVNIDHYFLPQK